MNRPIVIALLLAAFLASHVSLAQSIEEKPTHQFTPGSTQTYLDLLLNVVTTNFHYGKMNSALSDYKSSALGAQVGVSFKAGITPRYSIVSEFYFMMKGGKLDSGNPFTSSEMTTRLYSFELPILARFHFGRFHVNTGPSVAYHFHGTQEIADIKADIAFNNSTIGFNRWEFGAQVGAGYTFPSKKGKRIALDLRYNYGLTDMTNGQEFYNRGLIISLHFSKPWKVNPLEKK